MKEKDLTWEKIHLHLINLAFKSLEGSKDTGLSELFFHTLSYR